MIMSAANFLATDVVFVGLIVIAIFAFAFTVLTAKVRLGGGRPAGGKGQAGIATVNWISTRMSGSSSG